MKPSLMANSTLLYTESDCDSSTSCSVTAGTDSSPLTWLSSPCSSISHPTTYNKQTKPHKANQVAWEAMARLRRCCGRAIGLEHFRLLKRLGSGDIGSVYLCQIRGNPCLKITALYAMKVVDMEAVAVKKKLGRAEMEKKILGMLDHPFCPTLYASFEASHYSFLVMEYCPGGDLYAARLGQPLKRFSVSSTRFYAAETLVGLEYLHMMGIVYRDLKPENVLIRDDGHIMLSDFDLSFKCDVVPQLQGGVNDEDGEDEVCIRRKCSTPSCATTPLHPVISCFSPNSNRRRKNVITTTIHENAASTGDSIRNPDVSRTFSRPSSSSSSRGPAIVAEPVNARSRSFVGTHEYLAPEVISGTNRESRSHNYGLVQKLGFRVDFGDFGDFAGQGHGSAVDWWTYGIFLYEMIFGRTPFKGENNEKTLVNILKTPLTFPKVIVKSPKEYEEMVKVQDLIVKLLVKNPKKRLGSVKGSVEIKGHEFFEGVNWALIRSIKPPWVPKEDKTQKIKSTNHYLPPQFMMSRKERDEPYHVSNHFDYF